MRPCFVPSSNMFLISRSIILNVTMQNDVFFHFYSTTKFRRYEFERYFMRSSKSILMKRSLRVIILMELVRRDDHLNYRCRYGHVEISSLLMLAWRVSNRKRYMFSCPYFIRWVRTRFFRKNRSHVLTSEAIVFHSSTSSRQFSTYHENEVLKYMK